MDTVNGFELIEEQEIEELNTRARLFRHVKTGARLLSLENSDENKVFGITFRTPPYDSTGVPHIMEHSVLCGSEKYPLKEPFVELMKGSLNTFLNAFTYPDKTCYPVASQNLQDFYNLIDVYVDAVFYPLIPPHVLKQEGWHYELESLDDQLTYKGVVFNEMKGAYSSPDSLLGRYSQQSLFPDTAYGVDSGGDPQVIPDLTYEQFKAFHENYYHPSNAWIYFYGDDDSQQRLRLMDDYMQEFDALQVDSSVALQEPVDKPAPLVIPYPVEDEESKRGMVTINWLIAEGDDPEKVLGLSILNHVLIGTPASPLRKALVDSGLGEDLAGTGLEDELRQLYFSTGLKGIAVAEADKVRDLIADTLETLVDEGIEEDMVAASLNTIEFRLRENNFGSFPRGLVLMLRALTSWLYDGDPLAPLAFEAPLNAIQRRLEAGEPYFENLIREYLLDNPHRTMVTLKPDTDVAERKEAAERERLAQVRASMSQEQLSKVVEQTRWLKQLQETPDSPEALAKIPTLELADLDKDIKTVPLEVRERNGAQMLYHDLFTNGILYLDLGFDLHALPQKLLPYVPMFARATLGMGTETQDFVRLSRRIGTYTGGIHPATYASEALDEDQSAAWLFLRGKATMENAAELLSIYRDVLTEVEFDDRERFRQLLMEEKANQEAALIPAGHRVVNTRLRAYFDEAGWVDEQLEGIQYLFFLRDLADLVEQDWASVLDRLEAVREALVNQDAMLCNVTLDRDNWARFQSRLFDFLADLPNLPLEFIGWNPDWPQEPEGLTIPAQVNYVGKGLDLYAAGYDYDGSIHVIINALRSGYLWEKVRVQGGAYGGFSLFNHRSGVFTLLSYRDPNLLNTLGVYDQVPHYLREMHLSKAELIKNVIGAIGEMDAYRLPDAKGYISMQRYLAGEDDDRRQRRRDQMLATGLEDFSHFGETLARALESGRVVVMGSKEAIQEANTRLEEQLHVRKVL